jgi:hypothetical protein
MAGIAILGVIGFAWGITRKIDGERDQATKEANRALRAAAALRVRLRGRALLRSLRNNGKRSGD